MRALKGGGGGGVRGPCLMNKGDVKFWRSGFDAVVSALRLDPH